MWVSVLFIDGTLIVDDRAPRLQTEDLKVCCREEAGALLGEDDYAFGFECRACGLCWASLDIVAAQITEYSVGPASAELGEGE